MYDLLIRNATVVDGTGADAYRADVAVRDGKIVLNPDVSFGAAQTIDAAGLTLCPGFIDSHSHADERFGLGTSNLAVVSQGITTSATGQCGETMYPISCERRFAALQAAHFASDSFKAKGSFYDNTSLPVLLQNLEGVPIAFNYTMLTGHTTLRMAVMGVDSRKPTAQELEKMKALLRDAMEHGSMGLSSGLIYAPGSYADKEELTELCKAVGEYGG
ncbi:MAG: amidohydrolase family protein [Clostridia bacterium]|nr:amidohydrolase family protein [Clostridia bacterium]